jgi:tRNA (adenine57-N1/adenine58-N1)-methyltransferase
MPGSDPLDHVFRDGDHALIVDRRGRRYLVQLELSSTFHTHLGNLPHEMIIGQEEGVRVDSSRGHSLLALKPTMADFTRLMPRIATVVYPKDLGPIITFGDIFPGARVLEAGSGSGSLTIALARAVGDGGRLFSYDVRADMIERAQANLDAMVTDASHVTITQGDVCESIEEECLDRVVLDLPEPWHVVPHAQTALVPGGIFLTLLPTVPQVQEITQTLRLARTFDLIETVEVMLRPWSVSGRSIRPAQRMVGHTGFITTARRCAPRPRAEDANGEAGEDTSDER